MYATLIRNVCCLFSSFRFRSPFRLIEKIAAFSISSYLAMSVLQRIPFIPSGFPFIPRGCNKMDSLSANGNGGQFRMQKSRFLLRKPELHHARLTRPPLTFWRLVVCTRVKCICSFIHALPIFAESLAIAAPLPFVYVLSISSAPHATVLIF